VPDVRATVEWYQAIGFTVVETYGSGFGGLSFAILSFGASQVMFNADGQPGKRPRREVDLYVYTEGIDDKCRRLENRVEVVEGPHDTSYGMREFIIRDLNGFWITFGQPSAAEVLMNAVREGDAEAVRGALDAARLTPEALTAALVAASAGDHMNAEIVEMLRKDGAVAPPDVDAAILHSYEGRYENDQGLEVTVIVKHGTLFVALAGQPPMSLIAVDRKAFRPAALDGATITFSANAGGTMGLAFRQGPNTIELERVEGSRRP